MIYRVVLVNVSRRTNQIQFPIGLSVIVNALKKHGIVPQVIDIIPTSISEREHVFQNAIQSEPAIYGFSIMIGNRHLDEAEKYAKLIRKKNPRSIIVYGGSLPSSIPEMILERCNCDYVIRGEGEITFPALVQAICQNNYKPKNILGVYFKSDGVVTGTPNVRLVKLDHMSNLDFDMFNVGYYIDYLKEAEQSWELMASRGCHGNCSFCYKFMGKGLSLRKIDYVLDEIEYIIKNFKLTRFYFVDENFLESKKYFLEFIGEKNQRGLDFSFVAQARIDSIDKEMCEIGSTNGLVCISTGIESASQRTLERINKKISVKDAEEKLALMQRFNIRPSVNFIIGFPWETEQEYEDLYYFIIRNNLQKCSKLSYLTPLPSTPIFREAVERGFITNEFEYIRNLDNLYWERHINFTNLPDEVLDYYYDLISSLGKRAISGSLSSRYEEEIRERH